MEKTDKNTVQDISALGDSVFLVNKRMKLDPETNGKHTALTHGNIKRNVDHIKHMLLQEHIKTSENDLSVFDKCIIDADKFLADNTFEEDEKNALHKLR